MQRDDVSTNTAHSGQNHVPREPRLTLPTIYLLVDRLTCKAVSLLVIKEVRCLLNILACYRTFQIGVVSRESLKLPVLPVAVGLKSTDEGGIFLKILFHDMLCNYYATTHKNKLTHCIVPARTKEKNTATTNHVDNGIIFHRIIACEM